MKTPIPKISFPFVPEVGFQIGFDGQIFSYVGHRFAQTKTGRTVQVLDWTATCGNCGNLGAMHSNIDDARPSRHCAECRKLNRDGSLTMAYKQARRKAQTRV